MQNYPCGNNKIIHESLVENTRPREERRHIKRKRRQRRTQTTTRVANLSMETVTPSTRALIRFLLWVTERLKGREKKRKSLVRNSCVLNLGPEKEERKEEDSNCYKNHKTTRGNSYTTSHENLKNTLSSTRPYLQHPPLWLWTQADSTNLNIRLVSSGGYCEGGGRLTCDTESLCCEHPFSMQRRGDKHVGGLLCGALDTRCLALSVVL